MCCFPLESFESLETVNYICVICHTKFGKVGTIQEETVLERHDPGEIQEMLSTSQHWTLLVLSGSAVHLSASLSEIFMGIAWKHKHW